MAVQDGYSQRDSRASGSQHKLPTQQSKRTKRTPGGNAYVDNWKFRLFINRLVANDPSLGTLSGRVLRLKDYLSPDAPPAQLDMVIECLKHNVRVEVLYIQNFEKGFGDKQLEALTDVLRQQRIWAVNIGENLSVSIEAWHQFAKAMPETVIAYMYVSEHKLKGTDLKHHMRTVLRYNRKILGPRDPYLCSKVHNMWYNPAPSQCDINAPEYTPDGLMRKYASEEEVARRHAADVLRIECRRAALSAVGLPPPSVPPKPDVPEPTVELLKMFVFDDCNLFPPRMKILANAHTGERPLLNIPQDALRLPGALTAHSCQAVQLPELQISSLQLRSNNGSRHSKSRGNAAVRIREAQGGASALHPVEQPPAAASCAVDLFVRPRSADVSAGSAAPQGHGGMGWLAACTSATAATNKQPNGSLSCVQQQQQHPYQVTSGKHAPGSGPVRLPAQEMMTTRRAAAAKSAPSQQSGGATAPAAPALSVSPADPPALRSCHEHQDAITHLKKIQDGAKEVAAAAAAEAAAAKRLQAAELAANPPSAAEFAVAAAAAPEISMPQRIKHVVVLPPALGATWQPGDPIPTPAEIAAARQMGDSFSRAKARKVSPCEQESVEATTHTGASVETSAPVATRAHGHPAAASTGTCARDASLGASLPGNASMQLRDTHASCFSMPELAQLAGADTCGSCSQNAQQYVNGASWVPLELPTWARPSVAACQPLQRPASTEPQPLTPSQGQERIQEWLRLSALDACAGSGCRERDSNGVQAADAAADASAASSMSGATRCGVGGVGSAPGYPTPQQQQQLVTAQQLVHAAGVTHEHSTCLNPDWLIGAAHQCETAKLNSRKRLLIHSLDDSSSPEHKRPARQDFGLRGIPNAPPSAEKCVVVRPTHLGYSLMSTERRNKFRAACAEAARQAAAQEQAAGESSEEASDVQGTVHSACGNRLSQEHSEESSSEVGDASSYSESYSASDSGRDSLTSDEEDEEWEGAEDAEDEQQCMGSGQRWLQAGGCSQEQWVFKKPQGCPQQHDSSTWGAVSPLEIVPGMPECHISTEHSSKVLAHSELCEPPGYASTCSSGDDEDMSQHSEDDSDVELWHTLGTGRPCPLDAPSISLQQASDCEQESDAGEQYTPEATAPAQFAPGSPVQLQTDSVSAGGCAPPPCPAQVAPSQASWASTFITALGAAAALSAVHGTQQPTAALLPAAMQAAPTEVDNARSSPRAVAPPPVAAPPAARTAAMHAWPPRVVPAHSTPPDALRSMNAQCGAPAQPRGGCEGAHQGHAHPAILSKAWGPATNGALRRTLASQSAGRSPSATAQAAVWPSAGRVSAAQQRVVVGGTKAHLQETAGAAAAAACVSPQAGAAAAGRDAQPPAADAAAGPPPANSGDVEAGGLNGWRLSAEGVPIPDNSPECLASFLCISGPLTPVVPEIAREVACLHLQWKQTDTEGAAARQVQQQEPIPAAQQQHSPAAGSEPPTHAPPTVAKEVVPQCADVRLQPSVATLTPQQKAQELLRIFMDPSIPQREKLAQAAAMRCAGTDQAPDSVAGAGAAVMPSTSDQPFRAAPVRSLPGDVHVQPEGVRSASDPASLEALQQLRQRPTPATAHSNQTCFRRTKAGHASPRQSRPGVVAPVASQTKNPSDKAQRLAGARNKRCENRGEVKGSTRGRSQRGGRRGGCGGNEEVAADGGEWALNEDDTEESGDSEEFEGSSGDSDSETSDSCF